MRTHLALRLVSGLATTLCVLLAAGPAPAQIVSPASPCETFTVAMGEEADAMAIKTLIAELANAYAGNARTPVRIMRLADPGHFITNYIDFERSLQRDFDLLHNRQLICFRGTLSIRGELAVLDSNWEKYGFLGPSIERIQRRGEVRIQFMQISGPGAVKNWKITGFLGDFFGSTKPGDFLDLAVTAFDVPPVLTLGRPTGLAIEVRNLGAEPTTAPALVRVFDVTDRNRPVQMGTDVQVPAGLRGHGGATRVTIPATFVTAGPRQLLAIVDPLNQFRELKEDNNRRSASVFVGAESTIRVIPDPHTVTFPVDRVTVRVTDPDQAGKKTVRVRLIHKLLPSTASPLPAAFAQDEETIDLIETGTPGVFEKRGLETAFFLCLLPPAAPTPNNQKLEFPGHTCFVRKAGPPAPIPGLTGQLTVVYTDPLDALGRQNQVLSAVFSTRWTAPVPIGRPPGGTRRDARRRHRATGSASSVRRLAPSRSSAVGSNRPRT